MPPGRCVCKDPEARITWCGKSITRLCFDDVEQARRHHQEINKIPVCSACAEAIGGEPRLDSISYAGFPSWMKPWDYDRR